MHTSSRVVMLLCAGALMVNADTTSTETRLKNLGTAVGDIVNKAGISLGGEFRSEYLNSHLGGPDRTANRKSTETNEYTSVDFDIRARPVSEIGGRLVFRMHQNWQNFFSDISNPIFTRWISIDGTLKQVVSYGIGDIRLRYSPLTLWSPDIAILDEPEVFAQARRRAAGERFLGDNDRLLMGAKVAFDAEVYPLVDELHIGVLGTRLRAIETNIKNGSFAVSLLDTAKMEKYAAGGNFDALFLKGVTLGGTFLAIFDNKYAWRPSFIESRLGDTVTDTMAQRTFVFGIRPGVEIGRMLHATNWSAGVSAEVAWSMDDSAWWAPSGLDSTWDSAHTAVTRIDTVKSLYDTTLGGLALRAGVNGGIDLGFVNAHLAVDYISNARYFRNELAQSPSFIGTRIMNVDNDSSRKNFSWTSDHYSTFDALYGNVFKFAPADSSNLWYKAPFEKNSYTNAIFTQAEMERMKNKMDPSVQLVMPFGPATPNRQGITGTITIGALKDGLSVRGLFASLTEQNGDSGVALMDSLVTRPAPQTDTTVKVPRVAQYPATAFTQVGGGVKFDLASVAKALPYPLVLSFSLVHSGAKNAGPSAYAKNDWTITSDFLATGLYWKFWKYTALLGGMEMITNTAQRHGVTVTQTQTYYKGGLEWKVADGALVTATIGDILVKNKSDDPTLTPATDLSNLNFEQVQYNLALSVKF